MEQRRNSIPFSNRQASLKTKVWIGVGLCVLLKLLSYSFFSPWGFSGLILNLILFVCVLSTLQLALYNKMTKAFLNPALTFVYVLIPGIFYHLRPFFPRHNYFAAQVIFWIFLAVMIILTLFYLYEGTQEKRPLYLLLIPVTISLVLSISGFTGLSFRSELVQIPLLSLLILFGLYLLLSIFVTLLFTGSFGVTIRYWEWILTEPPKKVVRAVFQINRDKVNCKHCDRIIPLVGTYTCSTCKFTFKGHYFDWCPYCYSRFGYINCDCGLSRKRPILY